MRVIQQPTFRIWIQGRPLSARKRGRASTPYTHLIQEAAAKVVSHPSGTRRIDVESWYVAQSGSRPDVDNVAKPILDALKGILYLDDRQVRSVRIVAFPSDDALSISGWGDTATFLRLLEQEPPEFLVAIWHGLGLRGPGP